MAQKKKLNVFTRKFDYIDSSDSKTVVVTTATDLVAQIADIQSQGLAGTILLKSNLDLTTDTTLDLTGISINLNGFVIKQHGFKFRIKGTGFDIRNGSFDFNSYIPSQNNTANNWGMDVIGNAVDTDDVSTILINGIFDNVKWINYVGTLNDGNPNMVCSNSAGSWGTLTFSNCWWISYTGNIDGSIGITNCPFVIETKQTAGTSITIKNHSSSHHQCGNYSHCIEIKTNGIGAGINFFSDATCRLTSTNIVTDFTTKPTGGVIGVSIIGTTDEIEKLTETTDLTGKYLKVVNPVSKTLEKVAVSSIGSDVKSIAIIGNATGATYLLENNKQNRIITNRLGSGNQIFKLPIPSETSANQTEGIFKTANVFSATIGIGYQSGTDTEGRAYPQTINGNFPAFEAGKEYKFIVTQELDVDDLWNANIIFRA